jgi:hypothetical protein
VEVNHKVQGDGLTKKSEGIQESESLQMPLGKQMWGVRKSEIGDRQLNMGKVGSKTNRKGFWLPWVGQLLGVGQPLEVSYKCREQP